MTNEEQAKDLLESIEVHIADCNAAQMSVIACDKLNVELILKYADAIRVEYEEKLIEKAPSTILEVFNNRISEKDKEITHLQELLNEERRIRKENELAQSNMIAKAVKEISELRECLEQFEKNVQHIPDEYKYLKVTMREKAQTILKSKSHETSILIESGKLILDVCGSRYDVINPEFPFRDPLGVTIGELKEGELYLWKGGYDFEAGYDVTKTATVARLTSIEKKIKSVCAMCGGTGIIGNGTTSFNPQPCKCKSHE